MPLKLPPSVLKDKKALEAYVHEHIFPKVSQAQREYLAQFFTVLFSDGFESGNFSAWTGTSGSPSIVTDPVHHGNYACRLNTNGQYVYKTLSYNEMYMRVYLRWSANPATNERFEFFAITRSGYYHHVRAELLNDAGTIKWQLNTWDGAERRQTAASPNPTANTWYCVEIWFKRNTANGAKMWVDGNLIITSNYTTIDSATYSAQVGRYYASLGTSSNFYYDCVVVADAYMEPEGVFVEVADSVGLSDAILRNKTVILSDSLGLADFLCGNKSLLLSDTASLSELVTVIIGEVMKYVVDAVSVADLVDVLKTLKMSDTVTLVDAVSTPSRVLQVLEAIGATDSFVVNKVLQITETVSLAEIVEVGTGGVKKTKLFLIIGDLAVQITGD